jgi:hypothetical protein
MTLDPSISYGTIITLLVSIASDAVAYMLFVIRQDKHLAILTFRVEGLTEAIIPTVICIDRREPIHACRLI